MNASQPVVAVLVATANRVDLLQERTFVSVKRQSRPPTRLVVVDDSVGDVADRTRRLVQGWHLPGVNVDFLRNRRTNGAAGAWNSGLDHLLRTSSESPEHVYVAILDDDDEWLPYHLEACLATVTRGDLDLVAAPLWRLEEDAEPEPITPPVSLDAADFLVGNPGIQGSNLVCRLSRLLEAGLFDEWLPSCTDRDLCIRIADLPGVRYGAVPRPSIRHFACRSRQRLSTPGSASKNRGLDRFYRKYCGRMSEDQRAAFEHRAQRLFGWQRAPLPPPTAQREPGASPLGESPAQAPVHIVVGIIADTAQLANLHELLGDLRGLDDDAELSGLDVLVLENGCQPTPDADLRHLVEGERYRGLRVHLVDRKHHADDAQHGRILDGGATTGTMLSIADARTVLQSYLYAFAKDRPGSVVWILDDDMRLDSLVEEGDGRLLRRRGNIVRNVGNLRRLRAGGFLDIALGTCTGAPPLPVAATVRVQLVDLVASLQWLAILDPDDALPDRSAENASLRNGRRDYYYDLSRRETDRLEVPIWIVPDAPGETVGQAFSRVAAQAERILAGEQVFRPLAVQADIDPFEHLGNGVQRGGNTFVLDVEALRFAPNAAPIVDGRPSRRSDMLWALLQKRCFDRRVRTLPITAYQDRSKVRAGSLDVERIVDDVRGYAMYSALEDTGDVFVADGSNIRVAEDAVGLFSARAAKYLDERLAAFSLSFHRIRGLARILADLVHGDSWWSEPLYRDSVDRLRAFAERLGACYRTETLERIQRESRSLNDKGVADFLHDLPAHIECHQSRLSESNRLALAAGLEDERVANAKAAARRLACPGGALTLLGSGKEGVALSDGQHVYKVFDYWWKSSSMLEAPELLHSFVGAWRGTRHLYPILDFRRAGHRAVLVYPYEHTEPYSGGFGPGLIGLLEECWRSGIVCRNIDPDNLRVIDGRVRLIDYGSDIRALSRDDEDEFKIMCQRAWMSFRWAANPHLDKVMRKALTDSDIPELDGFERFHEAVLRVTEQYKDTAAHNAILGMAGDSLWVLDYGCGDGKLAQALAERNAGVVGYDPDEARALRWQARGAANLRFTHDPADAVGDGPYDLVVCQRVLCTIEGDDVLRGILRDLRASVAEDGRVVLVVCNPHFAFGGSTPEAGRELPDGARYERTFTYRKTMRDSGRTREDVYRPERMLRREFARANLTVRNRVELGTVDLARFEPASDELLFDLAPMPALPEVTLLIKACAMEASTLDVQVPHLVSQLESPRAFSERLLVLDSREDGFLREHGDGGGLGRLREAANALQDAGWIDRILVGSGDGEVAASVNRRWFGVSSPRAHAETGAQLASTLAGFEACSTRYVLQVDADAMIGRRDRDHDYLADMFAAVRSDPDALTVAFNIAMAEDQPYTPEGADGPWRVEVRASLIDLQQLVDARPFPNRVDERSGRLVLPWHRAVDRAIQGGAGRSYRGGDRRTFYVHPPNSRKDDPTPWFGVLDRVERGVVPAGQVGEPEWVGDLPAWLEPRRREPFVFVVSGRNVPAGRLCRCIESMRRQRGEDWGAVVFDDASDSQFAEYFEIAWKPLEDRCTIVRNRRRQGLLANLVTAIRHVCADPETVVVTLDADDALIGKGVLQRLATEYRRGADVTVGSMLRTDKAATYPVCFDNPRRHRGGNVWQHLRSFRKRLFDAIPDEDLRLDGEYVDLANDWAYMLPIVEMADHPVYIEEPLYLHEPSGTGKGADRAEREAIIARIVAKPSRIRGGR
ncbi:MAG: glycosyltransferase [Gammaproteobacteria bacterium]|nr:glycosyltransferase [Gammaproteobacteria bacterium]